MKFEEIIEKAREERESRIRPEIRALIERGNVTLAEHNELRCNSWEWEALVPALSIEALIATTEHAIKNCAHARSPTLTYDEAVHSVYAPELIKRLRNAAQVIPTNEDFVREAMVEHCSVASMDQRYITEWARRFAPALDKIRAKLKLL